MVEFDKIGFVDSSEKIVGTLTLNNPIDFCCKDGGDPPEFNIYRYLLSGIFTGDLEFLSHFLGHQGASARWLCMFCLARQNELHTAFCLAGDAPRFPKRQGPASMKELYNIYKCKYLDLDPKLKTNATKEQATLEPHMPRHKYTYMYKFIYPWTCVHTHACKNTNICT